MKITLKDLKRKIDVLNTVTSNPLKSSIDGFSEGHYYLHPTYGGYALRQLSGSSSRLIICPLNKKNLYKALSNVILGIYIGKKSVLNMKAMDFSVMNLS